MEATEAELTALTALEIYVPHQFPAIQTILSMDPQTFQSAGPEELKQWMYMLSQYLLYVTYQGEALQESAQASKEIYDRALNETAQGTTGKTLKERQALAHLDLDVIAKREAWELRRKYAARVTPLTEAVREMLYTVRAAYNHAYQS